MYLFETANTMFLSFIKFELLSFQHCNPISFQFIFYTFCPYLESLACFHGKDLIVQALYVHLNDRKGRVEVCSCFCHL